LILVRAFSIIPIISSLRLYATEKVRLRKLGKPINDEFDLLIGVTAVQNKMKLVTDNVRDFENIMGIQIENWFKR
jgi:tRNA(fMet)-specific endonuclease VapC